MPIYVVKCTKKECGAQQEVIKSFSEASKMICSECGGSMEIAPSAAAFKVNGFSMENGYHRETINYDGRPG